MVIRYSLLFIFISLYSFDLLAQNDVFRYKEGHLYIHTDVLYQIEINEALTISELMDHKSRASLDDYFGEKTATDSTYDSILGVHDVFYFYEGINFFYTNLNAKTIRWVNLDITSEIHTFKIGSTSFSVGMSITELPEILFENKVNNGFIGIGVSWANDNEPFLNERGYPKISETIGVRLYFDEDTQLIKSIAIRQNIL